MSNRTPLLALALLLALPAAAAEERWYEIELVIFARSGTPQVGEVWPDDTGSLATPSALRLLPIDPESAALPPASQATTFALGEADAARLPDDRLPPATKTADPYRLIPATRLQLSAEADRLARAGNELLFHGAWQQPVDALERTPTIYLGGLDEASAGTGDAGGTTDSPLFAGLDEHAAAMLREELGMPPLEVQPAPFEGLVQLSVRRYLHLKMNLVLRREVLVDVLEPATGVDAVVASPLDAIGEPAGSLAPIGMVPVTQRVLRAYPLVESRRMRSGDLHYLDHPAYGVLALATPVELPPEPAPEPEPATEAPVATPAETAPATAEPGTTPPPPEMTPAQ